MKRTHSDSENDEFYSGDEKEGEEGRGGISRKRRRGIIEKRRRDRINNSLSELRRLVPAAFEKQGSAKLEKAEILQMTVDHLKMLHTKGFDALAYDPNKFAMDYHNIGFRECAAEVARYMVAVEGLDIQDPLRLRLMSHLQCYSTQRELATKQNSSSWGWGSSPPASNPSATSSYPSSNASLPGFQGHMLPPPHHSGHHHLTSSGVASSPQHPSPAQSQHMHSIGLDPSHGVSAFSAPNSNHGDISASSCSLLGGPTPPITPQGSRMLITAANSPPPSMSQSSSQQPTNYHLNLNAHTFPANHINSSHHLASPATSSLSHSPHLSSNIALSNQPYALQGSSGVKPYRPWGAEIAY